MKIRGAYGKIISAEEKKTKEREEDEKNSFRNTAKILLSTTN